MHENLKSQNEEEVFLAFKAKLAYSATLCVSLVS